MGTETHDCCEQARETYIARLLKSIVSYPIIKEFPCPTCRRIVQVRVYSPPGKPATA